MPFHFSEYSGIYCKNIGNIVSTLRILTYVYFEEHLKSPLQTQ